MTEASRAIDEHFEPNLKYRDPNVRVAAYLYHNKLPAPVPNWTAGRQPRS